MPHKPHNIGIAAQIGRYSDAIETAPSMRWLFTSGTPGLETTGDLPTDITGRLF
jgi:2-iminobutanoate/2-iminopropanoate deaminase